MKEEKWNYNNDEEHPIANIQRILRKCIIMMNRAIKSSKINPWKNKEQRRIHSIRIITRQERGSFPAQILIRDKNKRIFVFNFRFFEFVI